uniref:Uncharacterized protein n=1 Tax=Solanum lycopersicum TaxID=4081 RepID=A0A3Q7IF90_SOLLC
MSLLHIFLFLGAYMWWSDQRMWIMRGLSSFPIGIIEYLMKLDHDQITRCNRGIIELGVASPMFVPLVTILIINLMAFVKDLVSYYKGENFDGLFLNTLIVCFGF